MLVELYLEPKSPYAFSTEPEAYFEQLRHPRNVLWPSPPKRSNSTEVPAVAAPFIAPRPAARACMDAALQPLIDSDRAVTNRRRWGRIDSTSRISGEVRCA